ncbi:hypothetical protein LNKW23_09010 [Paralimibaculum aggregatum]|uniref:Uncharacterized protein n=1 Tax=Paralimibaculum aggregatum TaxID=3036245 RepID=A0ABQ6LKD3_9RHOB|nr:hypothetical protein [Limibaculum sp. NKW23]GMG81688.1 hypothetical protein LNKW23_09010 [Limibaculum sp. NKW23]
MIADMTMRSFLRDESGVATVDWVALTASMMLLSLAVVYAVYEDGVVTAVDSSNETLEDSFDSIPRPQAPLLFRE